MEKISIEKAKKILWNKGYLVRTHYDSGIRTYKIWKIKGAKVVKDYIGKEELKEFALNQNY